MVLLLWRLCVVLRVSLLCVCVAFEQSSKVAFWKSLCVEEDRGGLFGFVLGYLWAGALRETVGAHESFGRRLSRHTRIKGDTHTHSYLSSCGYVCLDKNKWQELITFTVFLSLWLDIVSVS